MTRVLRILVVLLLTELFTVTVSAQRPDARHPGYPGEPVSGYFQPVMIRTPQGTKLAAAVNGQFADRLPTPLQVGFLVGLDYRLRITDIPFQPGKELFPTVTVIARTYPPKGKEFDYPIVVNLSQEDLELALEGKFVTRAVYLEDPKKALPIVLDPDIPLSTDTNGDPVAVAATQGLPVAIIRIGGRVPTSADPAFLFGCPPWQLCRTVPPQFSETLTGSRQVAGNMITVDPALTKIGANIVTEQGRNQVQGTWEPPTHRGKGWRQSEYLADGGDGEVKTYVEQDWTVRNLEPEDTVAHFDTVDGKTLVEPSNKVKLYAPRFGSVRKIEGISLEGQIIGLVENRNGTVSSFTREASSSGFTEQESKTNYARKRDQVGGIDGRRRGAGVDRKQGLIGYNNFETVDRDSAILLQRTANIGMKERLELERGAAKARSWMGVQGIKVQMNSLAPMEATAIDAAAAVFMIEDKNSKTSQLRLIKVASKDSAQPGEIVAFTLRFDNIGNLPIGNITILDNMTTRLEFLSGTALSSIPSGFAVEQNTSGSFTLRFEITNPLEPGQFGVVQFQCRVR
jgi:uncharacterized repeat protein (TIGR01451 family)